MPVKQIIKTIVPRPLWNKLRMLRLRYSLATYRRRRVRHNYGGYEMELELVDPMGEGWYDHDWPTLPEITFLKQHRLRPGARVFDIGAHQCVVPPVGAFVPMEQGRHQLRQRFFLVALHNGLSAAPAPACSARKLEQESK